METKEKGLFVLYLAAGALAGLVTAGGASAVWILAPFLMTFGNLNAYDAVGITLAVEFVLFLFLFCIKGGSYRLNWKTLIVGTIPLVAGTVAGSYFSKWIPAQPFQWILFGTALIAGIVMFVGGRNMFGQKAEEPRQPYHPWRYVWWMLLAGLLGGAFGLGSALIALLVVYGNKTLSAHLELDTGMILIAISAMTGYLTHSACGTVNLLHVIFCAAFALALFRLITIFMNTKSNVYTKLIGAALLLIMVVLMPIYLFV